MDKITRDMLDKAFASHDRTESHASLVKAHALGYLYHKQKGQPAAAEEYLTSQAVKKKVKQLEKQPQIKRKVRKQQRSSSWLEPTQDWGNLGL